MAKDLHDYNIIFVGMQKTAGILNNYFDRSAFGFEHPPKDHYLLQKGAHNLIFAPIGDPNHNHTDYGIIAKYPGPNDNTIFLFSGLWDSAASESIRNLTLESKIIEVENYMMDQLGYIPPFFEMLIEVNGVDRVGFETKILHLFEIQAK